jgi:two-component system response regulator (stage 0 sporulation protein A)
MKKILVVDDDKNFLDKLEFALQQDDYFSQIFTATNGEDALNIFKKMHPEIILTDLAMPIIDGYLLLENLKKENLLTKNSCVLFMADMVSESIYKMLKNAGADFCFIKPFNFHSTITQIKVLTSKESVTEATASPTDLAINEQANLMNISNVKGSKNEDLYFVKLITGIFHDLGMPAHINGYEYLRFALLRILENRKLLHSVTKELYPMIAKEFGSSPSRVERAIRHAIEVAWTRGDPDNIAGIFGCTVLDSRGKPTNSEFLAMIADRILVKLIA